MNNNSSTSESSPESQLSMPQLFDVDRKIRKSPEDRTDEDPPKKMFKSDESPILGDGIGNVVAAHYNSIEESGLEQRKNSRIFYLRNFNNWVKSMLIKDHINKLEETSRSLKVLDMCCGKGGDLLKWRNGNIKHLICADIAGTSVDQCRTRYEDMKNRSRNSLFGCEFITADCTKVRLREKFSDVTLNLDLVSCQFSFHYCFESLPQAEMMLKNASECLRTGGYFIGTVPDAADIVHRVRQCNSNTFSNELFKIELCTEEPYPLFGAKYNFYLEGVVDCPEFLVHFPTLEKLAAKFGLKLVFRERFNDYYERKKNEGQFLMRKMSALEEYPAKDGTSLVATAENYGHAERYLADLPKDTNVVKVGTLSHAEWEAISLYQVFVFEKVKRTEWSADGHPVYNL